MELNKIEKLLESWFEGQTTLQEEAVLMDFFLNENVPQHLLQYKPIFVGLSAARKEKMEKPVMVFEREKTGKTPVWKYGIAAGLVLALGVGSFYLSGPNPELTPEEQEALAAFEQSKEALRFLSENINKGTKHLALVDEFEIAKNKVFENK